MPRKRKTAAQNNNPDSPPTPKRHRGRQNDFTGVKLEFLDGFKKDFLGCTTLADVGAFYDLVTRAFVDLFGYRLRPEENPPEEDSSALKSSSASPVTPSAEAQEAENEARNKYIKELRKKLGNWYRHRFRSKDRSSTIMHILDSFSSVKPRRRLAREVYADLHWETKLKAQFDDYTRDLGDNIPSDNQLATRNKFLASKLKNESPEIRSDVEEQIEFEYQKAMEEWNTACECASKPESYRSAWNLANEVLPELSNALGQWLGGSVIIAAVAPEDGAVKVKTVQSSTSNGSLSQVLAERNPEGWKSFCKMYLLKAAPAKADVQARMEELKKEPEASAEDAPKQPQVQPLTRTSDQRPPPRARETSRDTSASPNANESSTSHDEPANFSPPPPETPYAHPSVSAGSTYAHVSPAPFSAATDIVAANGLPSTSTLPQPGGFLASLEEVSQQQPFNDPLLNGWNDMSMTPWAHPNYQSPLQSGWFNSGHSYPPSFESNVSAVVPQAHLTAYGSHDQGLSMSYPMSSVRGMGCGQNIDTLSTASPHPPAPISPLPPTTSSSAPTASAPLPPTSSNPIPVTTSAPVPPLPSGHIPTPSVPLPPTSSNPIPVTTSAPVPPTPSGHIPTPSVPLPPTGSGPIPLTTSGPVPPTPSGHIPTPLPPTSSGPVPPTPSGHIPTPLPPTSSGRIPVTTSAPVPPTNPGPNPTTSGPLPHLPHTTSPPLTAPDGAADLPDPDKESPADGKASNKRTAKENAPAPPTRKRKANQVDGITSPAPSVAPRRTRAQRTASGQTPEPTKARTSARSSKGASSPNKSKSSRATKTPTTSHQSKHGGWFTMARGNTPEPYYCDKLPI